MVTTTTGIATSFIQFSRASLATVTNNVGNIAWAGHNLLTNSESFDAAAWAKTNLTVTANAVAAPNGTTTVDQFLETVASGAHFNGQSVTTATGQYTFAVYAKPSGRNFVGLYNAELTVGKIFDISTGVVGSDITAAPISASVTSVGSGWYRCEIVVNATLTTTNWRIYICDSSSTFSYTGDITKGLYIWGASLYRSDLGGMVYNPAQPAGFGTYYPTTPKNLLGYTEDFSNAAWSKPNVTITANFVLAPNGLQTADLLTENTVNAGHWAFQSVTTTANPFTASAYFKAGTRSWAFIRITDSGSVTRHVWFDLISGSVGTTETGITASIVSVGNGWYSCRATIAAALAGSNSIVFAMSTGNGVSSYTGDGTSGIYLWGAQLSDSASIDPYSPNYGAAPTASAYYAPRLDYSPTTIQPLGMLVEEQRTNLITQSGFTNGLTDAGTRGGLLTATTFYNYLSNTSIAFGHDGITSSYAYNSMTPAASTAYVFSTFVRMDDGNAPSFGSATATSNLNDFVVVNGGAVANMTLATITNMGNNIYRVSIAVTTSGSPIAGVGVLKYAQNSSRTFRVTGYQLEAGSFATSYIPTGAATATRSADVASVSAQAFPYSATEGTLVASVQHIGFAGSYTYIIGLSDGTLSNVASLATDTTLNSARVRSGGADVAIFSGPSAVGGVMKSALAIKQDDFAYVVNGGSPITDTAGAMPVGIINIAIPLNNGGARWIRQVTYLPRRISNAELQTRTT